uniref:Secreted protein n=1 Tax=Oryza brachyantha TaxID=4533 RepID=J3KZ37_ORYBR
MAMATRFLMVATRCLALAVPAQKAVAAGPPNNPSADVNPSAGWEDRGEVTGKKDVGWEEVAVAVDVGEQPRRLLASLAASRHRPRRLLASLAARRRLAWIGARRSEVWI